MNLSPSSASAAPLSPLAHTALFAAPDARDGLFNDRTLPSYRSQLHAGLERIVRTIAGVERPFSGIAPAELASRFGGIDLDRSLPDLGQALDEVDALYLRDAVYFHHPRYAAHLNCPVLNVALLAELMLSAVNTSMDTWDQSGGATFIEQKLVDWTASRIGLGRDADGVFTSGGTQSNLMAMLLARDSACAARGAAEVRHRGLPDDFRRLRIFASRVGHFSVQKAAAVLGLGHDAVVPVACDAQHRMDPEALAQALDA
ncbi:pyridoxal-dependent decarboxylase, partial [Xanthomonas sp. Kuri4-1]